MVLCGRVEGQVVLNMMDLVHGRFEEHNFRPQEANLPTIPTTVPSTTSRWICRPSTPRVLCPKAPPIEKPASRNVAGCRYGRLLVYGGLQSDEKTSGACSDEGLNLRTGLGNQSVVLDRYTLLLGMWEPRG